MLGTDMAMFVNSTPVIWMSSEKTNAANTTLLLPDWYGQLSQSDAGHLNKYDVCLVLRFMLISVHRIFSTFQFYAFYYHAF